MTLYPLNMDQLTEQEFEKNNNKKNIYGKRSPVYIDL